MNSRKPKDETMTTKTVEFPSARELIVISKPEAALRSLRHTVSSLSGRNTETLNKVLSSNKAIFMPLFGSEDRISLRSTAQKEHFSSIGISALSSFYHVIAEDVKLDTLAKQIQDLDIVEAVYIKPAPQPPIFIDEAMPPPSAQEAPPVTPDFNARQLYLDAAPGGIDARFSWTLPGGTGQGVQIIDIEGAWRFSHEDLVQNQGGVIGGTESADLGWRNHGTAVSGEFGGDRANFGITGICPDANVRAISIFGAGQNSAKAVTDAANALNPGDIILIELHAPGPRNNFVNVGGQLGYIPMEFWPDMFAAIVYATSVRGVIVVEAGGNGSENLDDALYDTRPTGFPQSWRNPFNPANPQSGAIIVGAGAPPPNTHGRNHGADRSRLAFSNYGARIDVQGWGREVTTTGYGDLQGGTNEDFWYTDTFSGTSSASPIVVGALGCIQGVIRAAGNPLLTPEAARTLLRNTGSPQQDEPGRPATQRIGNRPDLRQMLSQASNGSGIPLYRYYNGDGCDHFYTTGWGELGNGNYGWNFEGIQCYVYPDQRPGTIPLYRYYNGDGCDHFYTTSWDELGNGNYGWNFEGIQCYVLNQQYSSPLTIRSNSALDAATTKVAQIPATFRFSNSISDLPNPIPSTFSRKATAPSIGSATPTSFLRKTTGLTEMTKVPATFQFNKIVDKPAGQGDVSITVHIEK